MSDERNDPIEMAIEAPKASIDALGDEFDPIARSSDSIVLEEVFADVVEFVIQEDLPTTEWDLGDLSEVA